MHPWDPEDAHRALSRAAELLDNSDGVLEYYISTDLGWEGEPGSRASVERLAPCEFPDRSWLPRVSATVLAEARLNLISASEFLTSEARLLRGAAPTPGHLGMEVLARAALETSSRAWWLLDPRLSIRKRVARGMADRLYSAQQAKQLADSVQVPKGMQDLADHPAVVEQVCRDLGLTCSVRNQTVIVDGAVRPGATSLVDCLVGTTIYRPSRALAFRLFSATSHGTHYAAMRAFEDRGARAAGERYLERMFDPAKVAHAIGFSVTGFEAALRRAVEMTGQGRFKIDVFASQIEQWARTLPAGS